MGEPHRVAPAKVGAEGGELTPEKGREIDQARTGGHPLDDSTRESMESAFGADFRGVRVHTGATASRLNDELAARAFTTGSHIFFREGEYAPESSGGKELLAHELTHVVQGGTAVQGNLAVGPADHPAEREADQVASTVMGLEAATSREPAAPGGGVLRDMAPQTAPSVGPVTSVLVEATESSEPSSPEGANEELGRVSPIAARHLPGGLARSPLLRSPLPGIARKTTKPAATAAAPDLTYGPFRIRIPGKVSAHELAVLTFMQVFSLDRKTSEIWVARSKWTMPVEVTDAEAAEGISEVRIGASFFRRAQREARGGAVSAAGASAAPAAGTGAPASGNSPGKLPPEEQKKAQEEADKEFEKRTGRKPPGKSGTKASKEDTALLGEIRDGIVSDREIAARYEALPPEIKQLITGDGPPSTDYPRLLRIAEKLAQLSAEQRGFYCRIARKLAKNLDEFESSVDDFVGSAGSASGPAAPQDKKLHGGTVLGAFVRSVGTGLAMVAVGGLVVGAEILTAGQVTWLFVAFGAAGGFNAYLSRREEIESSHYDVPRLNTAIHAVGDIFGASGVIEGASGHRLGTNVELSGQVRSEQLGAGLGSIATILTGSRAFNQGRAIGKGARAAYRPVEVPSGPNAKATGIRPNTATAPPEPQPNPGAGPLETAKRAATPPTLQKGFDAWSESIRAKGKSPEGPLGKMSDPALRAAIEKEQARYDDGVAKGKRADYERARAQDDPLQPQLHEEQRGNIKIRYDRPGEGGTPGERVEVPEGQSHPNAPTEVEIAHAQQIATRTGEPVTLFGKNASGLSYPGIDGVIGEPPRPLQLKSYSPNANAGSARFAAQQALAKAKGQGYSHVQVEISMPGKTVAEVKAAWDAPPRPGDQPLSAYYEGSVVSKIIIRCSDGIWSPPLGPSTTGVLPQQPRRDEDDKEKK